MQERVLQQPYYTYIQLLHILLGMKYCVKIREDYRRLKERLRCACKNINSKLKGKTRVSFRDLMQTELKLTVRRVEYVEIKTLETQSRNAEEKVNPLLRQNVVLRVLREELERKSAKEGF